MEVGLRYVGKKLPFTYRNPILGEGAYLRFADKETVVPVNTEIAAFILKHNPTGFVERVDIPGEIEIVDAPEVVDTTAKMPKMDLICPHCFKSYTDKYWFDKHVLKCSGDDDDSEA